MAAEEKHESNAESATGSSEGGGSKLVMMLTAVNLLATVGMVAVLALSFSKDKKSTSVHDIATHEEGSHGAAKEGEKGAEGGGEHGAAAEKKKSADFGKMITLEQFTVNLSTPGSVSPKYVRVNISLEVPNDDAESEITQKMPQVRNAVIDLFNSKRPADLATAEGRDYLKEEIRNALNAFMITGKVKGVYFTNFAVSS